MAEDDRQALGRVRTRDLVLLALVERLAPAGVDRVAAASDTAPWRVKLALGRLKRRGLVRLVTGEKQPAYVPTELAARLGVGELVARLLADIEGSPGSATGFAARRLRVGSAWDRSALTGPHRANAEEPLLTLARFARRGAREERLSAVDALGAVRDPMAAPTLVAALEHDEDEIVRLHAARALARSGRPTDAAVLRHVARNGSSLMREAAADTLGTLGDRDSHTVLVELLAYPTRPVREAAARALGRIGDPRAVAPLTRVLADEGFFVRATARQALIRIGGAEAAEALRHNRRRLPGLRRLDARRARRAA